MSQFDEIQIAAKEFQDLLLTGRSGGSTGIPELLK